MTQFVCITFGPRTDNPQQFYNERTWWDHQKQAEQWGLKSLSIAGCFGYVVIEEGEDWWEVVNELGAPDHCTSISCDNRNTFNVQPAPQLILL